MSDFDKAAIERLTRNNTHNAPGREIIEDGSDSVYYDVPPSGANLYTCPSCGAEIITEPTTSATICWYCHSPISFTKHLSGEFKPSKIIPFQKSKQQALYTFKAWCMKKKFLPKDFCSPRQFDNITGVYVPYWLVDCDTRGHLNGTGKKYKSWRSGDYRYTQTDIYSINRSANISFSLLPHDASRKADDKVMESIAPFDYSMLKDFSYSYLSGFIAEKYDVSKEDIYPVIKQRVEAAVISELRSSVNGYSSTSFGTQNVQINRTRFHYALMPIWMLTYQYHGQTYLFAMNGQTGKTYGALPISHSKVNKFATVCFIITFAITLYILLYIGGIQL